MFCLSASGYSTGKYLNYTMKIKVQLAAKGNWDAHVKLNIVATVQHKR